MINTLPHLTNANCRTVQIHCPNAQATVSKTGTSNCRQAGKLIVARQMLCDLMEEDWAATHAAQALGQCRSSADQISRRLKAIELVKPDDRAIANGATVARLEKDDSRRWHVMTAVLRLLRQPKYASGAAPDSQRSDDFLLQTLQTLHREGISIEPLRTELEFLAIDQPCLHFPTRAEIVTILAEISPNDPRWLSMLKSWRAQEDISFGTADLLIDTLPQGLQSKIR